LIDETKGGALPRDLVKRLKSGTYFGPRPRAASSRLASQLNGTIRDQTGAVVPRAM